MAAINLTKLDNLSGVPLLTVLWCDDRDNIPPGFGPSDGQLLPRSVFPDAFTRISNSPKRVVSDAAWLADPLKRGKYTLGDGSTNFRVPDLNGKQPDSIGALYLRGDGKNAGSNPGDLQGDVIGKHLHFLRGAKSGAPTGGKLSTGTIYTLQYSSPGADVFSIDNDNQWTSNHNGLDTTSTGGPENRPVSATGCFIIKLFGAVIGEAQANIAQMATDIAKLQSDVQLKLNKSNIVGLVANGAIIESGSSSNGTYIKYADGTMICTGNAIVRSGTYSILVNHPAVFIDPPTANPSVPGISSSSNLSSYVVEHNTLTTTSITIKVHVMQATSMDMVASDTQVKYIAIGRWKA